MAERRAPNAPSDFHSSWRKVWREAIGQLQEQGTWADTDRHLLELWVRSLIAAEAHRQTLADWIAAKGSVIAQGSTGQPVAHPATKLLRESVMDAASLADKLLLSPQSRERSGAGGEGDEDDDFDPTRFLG